MGSNKTPSEIFNRDEIHQSVSRRFEQQALRFASKPALIHGETKVSYARLNAGANGLAQEILQRTPEKTAPIGILAKNDPLPVFGMLAALKAGSPFTILDAASPQQWLRDVVSDSGIKLLLCDTEKLSLANALMNPLNGAVIDIATKVESQHPEVSVENALSEDVACIVYTSGTTGKPMGICHTNRNIMHSMWRSSHTLELTADDNWLTMANIAHMGGINGILRGLINGATVVFYALDRGLAGLEKEIRDHRITILQIVPSLFRLFVGAMQADADLPDLRLLLLGGEAVFQHDALLFKHHFPRGCRLVNHLGCTEFSGYCQYYVDHETDIPDGVVPVGFAPQDATVYLVDETGKRVADGEAGEIVIESEFLATGYWRDPQLTEKRFKPAENTPCRLYMPGDIGRFLPNGALAYLGRKDFQLKIRGYRIETTTIDAALHSLDAIQQAVVVAHRDEDGTPSLIAYVVSTHPVPTVSELRQSLSEKLPDYMIPATFVFMDTLPLQSNGKIDRSALPQQKTTRPHLKQAFVAPGTPLEKKLARIWSEVLKLDCIGVYDNFFDLGGHSLIATQMILKLQNEVPAMISLSDIHETPTISALAEKIVKVRDVSSPVNPFRTIKPDVSNKHKPFPLTQIQQAYWAGRNNVFSFGDVSTHVYNEIEIPHLDISKFNAALKQLIDRHDMLRAFVLPDGRQQILVRAPNYQIECYDFRDFSADVRETQLDKIRQSMVDTVLPADRWPLFDVRISQLAENRSRVHISIDALIADAFSKAILYNELAQLYQAPEAKLKTFELSFRDCVIAEAQNKDSENYHKSQAYWMARVATLPDAPLLPLVKSPSTLRNAVFVRKTRMVEKRAWHRLKTRATQAGLTPSAFLMTAFCEVLKIWSKQSRFTLNLTFFNRPPLHPEIENIVGDFTSLLLLEVSDSAKDTFENRARSLQRQLWLDLDHRFFSGVEVIRERNRVRGKRIHPLMPIVFTSLLAHNRHEPHRNQMEELGELVFGISKTSQVWLDHVVFEKNDDLILRWNIIEELFPGGLIDDMFSSYQAFLKNLADDENVWQENRFQTAQRLMLTNQLGIRNTANATDVPLSDAMLHTLFFAQSKQNPYECAVISPERTLTYEELDYIAGNLGHTLRKMGARPNTLVAVVLEKGWEQAAAVLGILAAGAAYLPIDPELPKERIDYLITHGEAAIVLTVPSVADFLDFPRGTQVLTIEYDALAGEEPAPLESVNIPTDLAYVIFTSGSTGQPKGVMIDHRGAVNTLLDINNRFDIGVDDVVLALSALTFDLSVYDLFGIFAAGGTVIIPEPSAERDPARWAQLILDHQVTIWNTVPALMGLLVDYGENHPERQPQSLRLVMLSGDWIPMTLPGKIQNLPCRPKVVSLGGATEASIWSILYPIEAVDPEWQSIPYGKPMTNQRFHVLNEVLAPCPVWVTGTLYIEGVGLAHGYWKDSGKTEKSFIVHPRTGARLYCTGDLGRYLPDGNIEFLGREDAQVKIQGFRVELGEIEAALAQHPDIYMAVAAALGSRTDKQLVAYLVSVRPDRPSTGQMRTFLKKKLPDYMIPTQYMFLDELPLTPNGKVDRNTLPDIPAETTDERHPDAVESTMEKISGFVAGILGTRNIAPRVDLFNLGANSIHMIRIINLLEAELQFRPAIDEFYRHPTVEWLTLSYEKSLTGKEVQKDGTISESRLSGFEFISNLEDREKFKAAQPGLRNPPQTPFDISLFDSRQNNQLAKRFKRRRSVRRFSPAPIAQADLGGLLESLRQIEIEGKTKYLYGSAGGLYPVQVYLYIKPGRVTSVDGGIYYYDPVAHRLSFLSNELIDETVYHFPVNRPMYESAAFAIFLIAQLSAIAPMYKEKSISFSMIEAGLICQLLETVAPDFGLGLCQVGNLEFDRIRPLFDLDENHLYVHSLVGGLEPEALDQSISAVEAHYGFESIDIEREEGEL